MKFNVLKKPKLMALGVPVALMSQCAPQQCAPAPAPAPLTVTHVVDGDTVDVSNGVRIRIIGIDTPEAGQCGYQEAKTMMTSLVLNKPVVASEGARDNVDQYGRLLRYVDVSGVDAGRKLIERGYAVARYDSRDGYGSHPRESDYVALDATTQNLCAVPPVTPPTTQPPAGNCHPAYVECLPIVADLDCGQIGHRVRVRSIGTDPYRLDEDRDGLGCESY